MTLIRRRAAVSAATTIALTATSLIGLMSTALPVAAAPKATAPKATPAPVPGYVRDLGISGATSMVSAGGKLFVGVADTVQVRDLLGNLLQTISGEPGVSALLASPDGSTVYAADRSGSAISMIDAGTAAETAHWTVSGCPTSLALAAGRLFYSFGCGSSTGIESVDAATGDTPVSSGVMTAFAAPPLLAGSDGLVVAAVSGTSTAYAYTPSGTDLSENAEADTGSAITTIAVISDGSQFAVSGPASSQVSYYDAYLNLSGGYQTGSYASALAYNGPAYAGKFATGLNTSGSAGLQVFDLPSTNLLTSVSTPVPSQLSQAGQLAALPGGLSFGPDTRHNPGAMIYALATAPGSSHDYLEAGPASPLAVPTLTIGVGTPQYYGQSLLVAVTFPGHPNLALNLHVHPVSGVAFGVPVRTNQWGTAVTHVPVAFSGQIFASYTGDVLTYHELPGNTSTISYTAPSATSASTVGSWVQRGGVRYYRSAANVQLQVVVAPAHVRTVSVVLQIWQNQLWLSVPTATFTTNQWGALELYLPTARRGVLYRANVTTPSSVYNTASTARSPVFAIS